MKKVLLVALLVFLIGSSCLFLGGPALSFSFSVSPSSYEIILPPGKEYTGYVEMRNSSGVAQDFSLYLEDWYYDDGGEKNTQPAGTLPYSLDGWISFEHQTVSIKADETRRVKFTVKAPADATGERYGIIFAQTAGPTPKFGEKSVGVTLSARIGIGLAIYTTREPDPKGEVTKFEVEPPAVNKPLQVNLDFQNNGNTPINVTGQILLFDKEGRTYWNQTVSNVNTLPGKSISKTYTWESNLTIGAYTLLLDLKYPGKDDKEQSLSEEKQLVISDDLAIEKLSAVYEKGGFKYFVVAKNIGSFPATISGSVLLESSDGQDLKKFNLPAAALIPDGTRLYTEKYAVKLKPGVYKVTAKVNNEKLEKTKAFELTVK